MLRALLIYAAIGTAAYAAGPLDATFAMIDQAAAKYTGLAADVRQVTHTGAINEDVVDIGTILIKRARPRDIRMLLDIKEPDAKQVLIDTKTVQQYFPKSLLVQEFNLAQYRSTVEQGLLLAFGTNSKDLAASYSITPGGPETIAGEKTTRLELVPKSSGMLAQFKRVDLWISDTTGLTVQQKLFQSGGDYHVMTYSNMKPGKNLPDPELKLPKGVKREYPQKK
jgi:outer membrane lipoprotein-sorting protein